MKISITVSPNVTDTEINIVCGSLTPEIERIANLLRMTDQKLTAKKNGESYILDVSDIMYVEAVDRRIFVYTAGDCLESGLKLYEMEERLCQCGFLRVSRTCLVNIKFIRSIKNELNHKLRITLENGEQIIASRQYAEALKQRLGVK